MTVADITFIDKDFSQRKIVWRNEPGSGIFPGYYAEDYKPPRLNKKDDVAVTKPRDLSTSSDESEKLRELVKALKEACETVISNPSDKSLSPQYWLNRIEGLGSAETGGEKADEVCPICGTLDYGCCPAVAIGDPWVCLKHPIRRRDFGEDLADMVKAFPTVPRSSQNQTVSTGVEGAHAGTTADKSGEPEKLNNACPFCKQPYRLVGLSTVCGCMAESSLSSPPPKSDLSVPTTPAPSSTQLDTTTEKI